MKIAKKPSGGLSLKRPASAFVKPRGPVLQKPASSSQAIVSYHDVRKFKEQSKSAACPPAIRDEVQRILGLGYGKQKTKQIAEMASGWKVAGWDAPQFKEAIEMSRSKVKDVKFKPVPWAIMVKDYGGDLVSLKEDVAAGEVKPVPNPINSQGKAWWVRVDIEITHKKELKRTGHISNTKGVVGNQDQIEGFFDQLAGSLEDMEADFDLGEIAADIPGPSSSNAGQLALVALSGADTNNEEKEKQEVMAKVSTACRNIGSIVVKILEWQSVAVDRKSALSGAKKHILDEHVFTKLTYLNELQTQYQQIVTTKKLPGDSRTSLAADIRAKLAQDAKEVSVIMGRLKTVAAL